MEKAAAERELALQGDVNKEKELVAETKSRLKEAKVSK